MSTASLTGVGFSETSVAEEIRSLLRERKPGQLFRWNDLAQGDNGLADKRDVIQLALSNLIHNRKTGSADIQISRVYQGVYYLGQGEPETYQLARKVARTPEGVGPANETAAFYLKLRKTEPEIPEYGFPERPPKQPAEFKARWVSRSGCIGRRIRDLNQPAISILETLAKPELITVSQSAAVEIFASLIEREQVAVADLIAAAPTEPAVARESLRNLLLILERAEVNQLPSALNKSVKDRAFGSKGG